MELVNKYVLSTIEGETNYFLYLVSWSFIKKQLRVYTVRDRPLNKSCYKVDNHYMSLNVLNLLSY